MAADGAVRLTLAMRNYSPDQPASWAHLVDLARAADEAGVHRLVLSDHVAMGADREPPLVDTDAAAPVLRVDDEEPRRPTTR